MTQRTFLTSTVLTVVTGQIFCQPDLAFGLIHALTTAPGEPTRHPAAPGAARADLLRQFGWIAGLDVPDLDAAADPRRVRWEFLARVTTEHGATQDVTVRGLPALTLPARLPLVRLR